MSNTTITPHKHHKKYKNQVDLCRDDKNANVINAYKIRVCRVVKNYKQWYSSVPDDEDVELKS